MKANIEIMQDIINRLYADLDLFLNTYEHIDIDLITKDKDYYGSGIHASTLGSCKRKVVLEYAKYEKTPYNLQTLLNFTRGNMYHELVYQWLKWSEEFTIGEKEFNVSAGLPDKVTGTFDVTFKDLKTNLNILADIKTASSNQFKKFIDYLPKPEHIMQLSAYAYGYKKLNHSFDLLMMMYFSNGSDHPQFYFVDYNPDIENKFNEYIQAVNDYETSKKLPARLDATFNKDLAWSCDYCNFKNISCEGLVR